MLSGFLLFFVVVFVILSVLCYLRGCNVIFGLCHLLEIYL
jgi:hypothetical protein